MLMEELFSRGIMVMGPSRIDPNRQVCVFNPDFISGLPALRAAEMGKVRWIAGDWNYKNIVPATRNTPTYTDIGSSRFLLCDNDQWVCFVTPDGRETRQITFDPFSRQWIYLLMQGAYGMLRSPQGWVGDEIVFTGLMTMIGINSDWRMTWTRHGADRFSFINEERNPDGSWVYIDEWRFQRKSHSRRG